MENQFVKGLTDTVIDDDINNMNDEISSQQRNMYVNRMKKNVMCYPMKIIMLGKDGWYLHIHWRTK